MEKIKIISRWVFIPSLILLSFACNYNKEKSTVFFNSDQKDGVLYISNVINEISDTLKVNETMAIDGTEFPMILYAALKGKEFYIYLEKGKMVEIIDNNNELIFCGELAVVNNFLYEFDSILNAQLFSQGYNEFYKMDYDDFSFEIITRRKILVDKITETSSLGNPGLTTILEKRIDALMKLNLLEYPDHHKLLVGISPETPQDYPDKYMNILVLNDADFLYFEEGRNFLKTIITRTPFDNQSTGDYYLNLYEQTKELVSNAQTKTYLQYVFIREHLHFSDSIREEYVQEFLDFSTNELMNKKITSIMDENRKFKKGEDAPFLSGRSRDGQVYTLDDFRGKWIYLDIWATWCTPCYREFPHFRFLTKNYRDKNIVFVALSVDELNDFSKWQKITVNEDLGGVQLFGDNGWNSHVITNYQIKNIPRFILVDPEGKIYDVDAPRPSDQNLHNIFKVILK